MNEADASNSVLVGTSVRELQARLDASPFNAWMEIRIMRIEPDLVHFVVPSRPEFLGTRRLNRMHGGVLMAMIDAAAGYTLMARIGSSITSVDLRVDFHRVAAVEELTVQGSVVKLGRKLACVDVRVFSADNLAIASGRGTFYIPSVSPSAEGAAGET